VKISIIIPVLNQVNKLDLCLSELYSQIQNNESIEVIVVDNGSDDGSQNLAKKYNFKAVHFLDSKNPYKARNKGAEIARGINLVFLDAKCMPLDNYILELERIIEKENWGVVAGDFEFLGLTANSSLSELAYAVIHLRTNPILNGGEVSALTGNMMVKRNVFFELGKFVEKRSGSDVRFSQMAEEKRKRKIFASNLKVGYHAKNYSDLIQSIKRVAKDVPHKLSIKGVRPAGSSYIVDRLKGFNIEISAYKKFKLRFFIMYLRLSKYIYQFK
jgi:glycosyltransferase involved in cell wall biosynthesis